MKSFLRIFVCAVLCLTLCAAASSCGTVVTEETNAANDSSSAASDTAQSALPSQPESTAPESTTEAAAEKQSGGSELSFDRLPSDFYFSSGVGAWSTELKLHSDGSFDGLFHDSDMGVQTMYYCTFDGKFGPMKKLDDNSYSLKLEKLNVTNDLSKFDYDLDDYTELVPSDPYGLENVEELILYLPGTPISVFPEDSMMWLHLYNDETVLPDDRYILFDPVEGNAFVGIMD